MNCETNDCRMEKRGCKGCFYSDEEENKCVFCDLKEPIYNSVAKIYEDNGKFRISTDECDTDINYCPMCGRKLV